MLRIDIITHYYKEAGGSRVFGTLKTKSARKQSWSEVGKRLSTAVAQSILNFRASSSR